MQNVLMDMQILSSLVEVQFISLTLVEKNQFASSYIFISTFLVYKYVFMEEPGIPGFVPKQVSDNIKIPPWAAHLNHPSFKHPSPSAPVSLSALTQTCGQSLIGCQKL